MLPITKKLAKKLIGPHQPWMSVLELAELGGIRRDQPNTNRRSGDMPQLTERQRATYEIFEGTEQIHQLVISRAISGLRIE